jgi:hypothetical protein
MLDKTTDSLMRCPKCNERMRLVEDAPHFAVLLWPWPSYRCEPCRIALSYPPDQQQSSTKQGHDLKLTFFVGES